MTNIRYISEADVQNTLSMPVAIAAVRGAFAALSTGKAHNVPRVRAKGKGIVLHSMSAAADYLGLVGWKQYTTTRHGGRFHVGLYSQETGKLTTLIEADRLGQLRTGAVTGLAVDLLAASDLHCLGILGTGWQAESQLEAITAVRTIQQVYCFSRREDRRRDFAERMSARLGVQVLPAENAYQAVADLPLVVTATSSREPVFEGRWLSDGALVCAVGSNWLNNAEIDVATVRRANRIVCDSIECCRNEAGDFVPALERGDFDWSRATELADVVTAPTVASPTDSITIFKSVGMAIEDIAVAAKLLELIESAV